MTIVRRPDGALTLVCGASRSGKTSWVDREVARERRLLVWDVADEWALRSRCRRVTSARDLAELVKPGAPAARIAYHARPSPEAFDRFCRLAWVWLRVAPGALVVEELADVTHPGKAPPAWGEIVRKGLRYGPRIFALTQRPSESDKTAAGNATVIHVHRMARPADRAYVAQYLDLPAEEVAALAPFQWIERTAGGGLRRGTLGKTRAK